MSISWNDHNQYSPRPSSVISPETLSLACHCLSFRVIFLSILTSAASHVTVHVPVCLALSAYTISIWHDYQTYNNLKKVKPSHIDQGARASGSEREMGRARASEIFPVSERQYIWASRSERNLERHDFFRSVMLQIQSSNVSFIISYAMICAYASYCFVFIHSRCILRLQLPRIYRSRNHDNYGQFFHCNL